MSVMGSRAASAAESRMSSAASRRRPSARLINERAASAASLVRSLSRPASSKSASPAWGHKDPEEAPPTQPDARGDTLSDAEAGVAAPTTPEDVAMEEALQEELHRDGMAIKDAEVPGCWQKFVMIVSSVWDTSDMKIGEDKEVIVRTTVREFVIYLVFLAILCVVTLSTMTPTMYDYTNEVQNGLISTPLWPQIGQIADFWQYMENDFMGVLFFENWYNQGLNYSLYPCPGVANPQDGQPCPIPLEDRMIMYSNRLLGVARMRQLRVRNDSCAIPSEFEDAIKVCYNRYHPDIEDKNSFGPSVRNYTSPDAWRYQNVKELSGNSYWGQLTTYSGAGSVQDLAQNQADTLNILQELQEGLWIGRGTRVIFVDFTMYNANINLFSVVKMVFEFPPIGGVIATAWVGTVKLIRYITPQEYALMGVEFVFAAFVLYYMIEEIIELKTLRLQYFFSFWNVVDLFVIIVSIATLSFNVYCYVTVARMLHALLAEPDLYADFSYLESWSKTFQDAAAITVFLGWVKIFKFISFNKTMLQLAGTISKCAPDVAAFSVMFGIVFGAYAQLAYIMFGPYLQPYNTLVEASYSQLRLILGDFDFQAIQGASRTWGPIYFLTYNFFVFFVLMNMFIAIINDTYSEVREEVANRREEFQVADYVMRGYNNIRESVYTRDKVIDITESVKLTSEDGVVTYEEIRERLRKLNFSDVEIEIFCSRYDRNGDFQFDLDEINAIEAKAAEDMENQDYLTLESERKVVEDLDASMKAMPKMNKAQFAVLESRVNRMESQMGVVITKVDEVLKQLDRVVDPDNQRNVSATMSRSNSARAVEEEAQQEEAEDENLAQEELNKEDMEDPEEQGFSLFD